VPSVLLTHEAKSTEPFGITKIQHGYIYFAIRGKSTTGFILPLGGSDWLDWSSDKDDILGLAQGPCNIT